MASQNPGEPPINAPVTDDKGNMTVPWHLWCVMMWKKIGAGSSLSLAWGSITGVLSAQADLVAAFAAKVTGNVAITGATHTKITYDSKGLVTAGADLVAGDIPSIAESQVTGLGADLSALSSAIAGKQAALGFTPENVANKTTDGTLAANSDTLYPSEKAVKTYVDGHSSAVPTGTGFRHVTLGAEDAAAAKVAIDTTADTSMTDVTTNNVSITKHGFAPKSPNDATKFLDGTGAYSVPPGTATGTVTHTSAALAAHAVVVGNGGSDAETIASTGSAGQYLRSGGASADPAMASIAESEVTNLVSDLAAKAAKVLTTKGDLATFDTVENRLGVGTDGTILIADSAQAKGIKWGNVSGASGSAAASGPYLVIGANSYVFPMHSCALPDTSITGFAWSNQNGAATAAQNGALLVSQAANGGGGISSLTKSIGASTTLIVAFIPTVSGLTANQLAGVTFYESATGKMESICGLYRSGASGSGYALDRWTTAGAGFNSEQFSTGTTLPPVMYMKLQISGSNIIFSVSGDGTNFIALRTEAKTAYFTTVPDKWGYTLAAGAGSELDMLVVSWEES